MTKRTTSILFAALLMASLVGVSPLSAQVKNVDQLKFPPLPTVKIPQPEKITLGNGMVVMLLADHELPLVRVTALVHTGSRLEPAGKVGLAQLAGEVLRTGGTEEMAPDDLDQYLETKAASIESSIGTTSGRVSMSCLAKDFPAVFKVFSQVLRDPRFDADRLKVAKTAMVASIARQNDNPQGILFREFSKVIYGKDSPYASNATYASVDAIKRADLVAWHREYYKPNRLILGIEGDFSRPEALALVRQLFGDWNKGAAPGKVAVPYRTAPDVGVFYAEKNDMTQSDILIGHLGITKRNPDFYAVEVMNQVLSGGFASRLFSDVRSKKGLAYAVSGSVGSGWDHPGTFRMFVTTKVGTTGAAIQALLDEAKGMTANPPTEEEVKKAKEAILNSFIFNSDSRQKILSQQLAFAYYGYPLDWLERYRAGIQKVTVPEVRAAAAKFIHLNDFSIVVVGPSKGLDQPLSSFGKVTDLDISIPRPKAEKVEMSESGKKAAKGLIDKAVGAFGGAEALDGLQSLEVESAETLHTPRGDMALETHSLISFPAKLRQEVILPMGKIVTVVTASDAWIETPRGVQTLPASRAAEARKALNHDPVALLRHRGEPGFEAAVTGEGTAGTVAVKEVTVSYNGSATNLGIDPESGRILTASFQGTGMSGAPGKIFETYSDFRETGGLTLPFASEKTFNGDKMSSSKTSSIKVNGEIPAASFTRPEAPEKQSGQNGKSEGS
ncbi:MAG TPA: pitrilysin family protein [Thermoanaerobaculia bacterium]|nr:pitrilysin family protein [Thermoanaerobaculia bacterium]